MLTGEAEYVGRACLRHMLTQSRLYIVRTGIGNSVMKIIRACEAVTGSAPPLGAAPVTHPRPYVTTTRTAVV